MALNLALIILDLSAHIAASLEELYSVGWGRSVYVCVCAFPALVILHLSMPTAVSLEEMYSAGWGRSIYAYICVFPVLVILHLLAHIAASLEKKYSVGLRQGCICVCMCVSRFRNSEFLGVRSGLVGRNVQCKI